MKEKGRKIIRRMAYALLVLCALSMFPVFTAGAEDIVIMLDPGHGGSEQGARRTWDGTTYKEELLNLKIAKYVKEELETYEGVQVYMTRTSNDIPFMGREERILKAKSKNATALVSIHINSTEANKQTKVSGSYAVVPSTSKYTNKRAKEARALGTSILTRLNSDAGTRNNGYWFDDELGIILYGMKYKIPSIIVEHCYVNNPNDCKAFLSSNAKLKRLGMADAAGIADYYGLKKKNGTGSPSAGAGWREVNGKYYYYDANGVLKTGVFKIGSDLYLSDKSGARQSGLVKLDGNYYCANSQGKLYLGWKTYNGKRYYFNPANGKAYKGLKKIGKYKYFFSKTAANMKIRWQTVSTGRKLYFNPKDGRMMKNCWVKSQGKYYYLSSNGKPYASTQKTINGKVYKFNAKGVCKNYK